ncbi:hypothetical protein BI350_05435 [Sporosarcina ureilytica]|uniref:Fluoride-specific ion channel FluC n=2 Tax=Sporosarcina ureilytica TaxID=298596 RepID=A0A1D8JEB3_9BACL|nr:hypothetical protein BI350_05435 [Sporosarcina ureilytica]
MTTVEVLVIGIGGFIGAVLRLLLSDLLNHKRRMPIGTLLVNLAGSLFIGIIFGLGLSKMWTMFLVSGFAGALTTFSTLQKEVIEQWQSGRKKDAVYYVILTYGIGIMLAYIGYFIVSI